MLWKADIARVKSEKVLVDEKKSWWKVIELLRKLGFGDFEKLIFFCEMILVLTEKYSFTGSVAIWTINLNAKFADLLEI
jgi:hypothetical protein